MRTVAAILTLGLLSIFIGPALAHQVKSFTGLASVYSAGYSGATADGENYDPHKFTCAHRTLPFGTRLRVTRDGHSVIVVVIDRGPFVCGRVLDLSRAAAKALHFGDAGVVHVTAKVQ